MENSSIFITTLIMAVLSLAALAFAYAKGQHMMGLVVAKNLLVQTLPLLVFAFILAGVIQSLMPADLISEWIGKESGFKGILIGSVAGGLLPGGPFVLLPLIAGMSQIGASIPVLVAMMTGWSLLAVSRLPMEIAMLGPKLTIIRLVSVFIFAPLAGLVARLIVRVFNL